LVVTARAEKESLVAVVKAGADDCIFKPFDMGESLPVPGCRFDS